VALYLGIQPRPPNPNAPPSDYFGLVAGGVGLALIYAGLDQGNRLDWLNSGLVWALLLSGLVLLVALYVHERRIARPLIDFKVVLTAPLPAQLLMVGFLRLTISSTAYLIPLYLGAVRGFRALEVGDTLLWIAAPQLILCLLAALFLRRFDARIVASIGFIFISVACLSVGYSLTPDWGSDQFLTSQLLQAVGQSFALSGVVFFGILHLRPQDALTFGAALQTVRLMGGEIGSAFIVTLARVRGQTASNLIGLHVQSGAAPVVQRVQVYGAITARAGDTASSMTRGADVLGNVVRSMATTQSVIDSFVVVGGMTAIVLLLLVMQKAPPHGPASPNPWFPRPGGKAA
jgi:MFS transporter, DHA2 family, multidrug resistance protein